MEPQTIGTVRSPLTDRAAAPEQGDEGSPEATIAIECPGHLCRYAEQMAGTPVARGVHKVELGL